MSKVRRFTEAVAHHRREIVHAAEAALAARLALQSDGTSRDETAPPSRRDDGVEGMLFVPVRPAVRGSVA